MILFAKIWYDPSYMQTTYERTQLPIGTYNVGIRAKDKYKIKLIYNYTIVRKSLFFNVSEFQITAITRNFQAFLRTFHPRSTLWRIQME